MASVTLAESAKLSQDALVSGVIENVITVNRILEVLPFHAMEGNAISYNRENALGAVENVGVGDTISAGKAAATFTTVTSSLTTIIGDAEVNGLIQATRSNLTDQTAAQVASKAKSIGRQYGNHLLNGTGSSDQFTGLLSLVDAANTVVQDVGGNGTVTNGGDFTLGKLDEMLDTVTDKDGEVEWICMHRRTIRALKALLRTQGGATIEETVTLPSGKKVLEYGGIPIYPNDFMPTDQTVGSSDDCTTVLCGTWDDGTQTTGVGGLTAANAAGVVIEDAGVHQSRDERITRVKWYCGLALYSLEGLGALTGVRN